MTATAVALHFCGFDRSLAGVLVAKNSNEYGPNKKCARKVKDNKISEVEQTLAQRRIHNIRVVVSGQYKRQHRVQRRLYGNDTEEKWAGFNLGRQMTGRTRQPDLTTALSRG